MDERLSGDRIHASDSSAPGRTRLCRLRSETETAAAGVADARNPFGVWRRPEPPEPAISRDEVLDIINALVDIKAWTYEIRQYLVGGDGEEEEDA